MEDRIEEIKKRVVDARLGDRVAAEFVLNHDIPWLLMTVAKLSPAPEEEVFPPQTGEETEVEVVKAPKTSVKGKLPPKAEESEPVE
jgi:hypothetical protein